jgi:hypothetical protein
MAQQAALRVHCDRAGSLRVGIPDAPGMATCEVAVHAAALPRDPGEVAQWLGEIVGE